MATKKFIAQMALFQKEMIEANKAVNLSDLQYKLIDEIEELEESCDLLHKIIYRAFDIDIPDNKVEFMTWRIIKAIDRLQNILDKEIKEKCQK